MLTYADVSPALPVLLPAGVASDCSIDGSFEEAAHRGFREMAEGSQAPANASSSPAKAAKALSRPFVLTHLCTVTTANGTMHILPEQFGWCTLGGHRLYKIVVAQHCSVAAWNAEKVAKLAMRKLQTQQQSIMYRKAEKGLQ